MKVFMRKSLLNILFGGLILFFAGFFGSAVAQQGDEDSGETVSVDLGGFDWAMMFKGDEGGIAIESDDSGNDNLWAVGYMDIGIHVDLAETPSANIDIKTIFLKPDDSSVYAITGIAAGDSMKGGGYRRENEIWKPLIIEMENGVTREASVSDYEVETVTISSESDYDIITDVVFLSDGRHYVVTGITTGDVTTGKSNITPVAGGSNAGWADIFLALYDSNNNIQWVQQIGGAGEDSSTAIAVDSRDNIYIAGLTYGHFDGNVNLGANSWIPDALLVKYNSEGIKQWSKLLGTEYTDGAYGVAVDSQDNVYMAGQTVGDLYGYVYSGSSNAFVAKYDSDGNILWVERLEGDGYDQANDIVVDTNNNVYITGTTNSNLEGNTSYGGSDIFIAKLDSDGNNKWITQTGTSDNDEGNHIAIDSKNNIYISGTTGVKGSYAFYGKPEIESDSTPVPDIRANDLNSSVTISSDETLFISLGLDSGSYEGANADWWLAESAPDGSWYFLNESTFDWDLITTEFYTLYQKPLFSFDLGEESSLIFEMTDLDKGLYAFYFAVDLTMDGALTWENLYFDYVMVEVE